MTFTAEKLKPGNVRTKRANFPFDDMRENPNYGFTIPAEQKELFAYCRSMVCIYNKKNNTKFKCTVQADGSMRVWQGDETLIALKASVAIAEQRKEQKQDHTGIPIPTQQQFSEWLKGYLKPGMSYIFGIDYAHMLIQLKLWAEELKFQATISYNPPSLKISNKEQ